MKKIDVNSKRSTTNEHYMYFFFLGGGGGGGGQKIYIFQDPYDFIMFFIKCQGMTAEKIRLCILFNRCPGRFRTRKCCNFYIIFHSIVQTNMKQKFVSRSSSSTTSNISSGCLECNDSLFNIKIERKKVHNMEDFSASRTT